MMEAAESDVTPTLSLALSIGLVGILVAIGVFLLAAHVFSQSEGKKPMRVIALSAVVLAAAALVALLFTISDIFEYLG
ncbi:MAG: hypothetical protein IT363_05880 [Methanoregulaceae archaeon]|nr:hypothetical protein [Methanoregulaceae archaeon]